MEEKKENNTTLLSYIIAFILLAIIVFAVVHWWNGLGNSTSKEDSKLDAYVMSQDFMKDYLTSPSSAKFPAYSKINVIQTNNRYKVEAYVESKNSLGTMVKTEYYMVLEKGSDGGWTKISCTTK